MKAPAIVRDACVGADLLVARLIVRTVVSVLAEAADASDCDYGEHPEDDARNETNAEGLLLLLLS